MEYSGVSAALNLTIYFFELTPCTCACACPPQLPLSHEQQQELISRLHGHFEERVLTRDQILFHEGQEVHELYLVQQVGGVHSYDVIRRAEGWPCAETSSADLNPRPVCHNWEKLWLLSFCFLLQTPAST
jgi:hypothetical protein